MTNEAQGPKWVRADRMVEVYNGNMFDVTYNEKEAVYTFTPTEDVMAYLMSDESGFKKPGYYLNEYKVYLYNWKRPERPEWAHAKYDMVVETATEWQSMEYSHVVVTEYEKHSKVLIEGAYILFRFFMLFEFDISQQEEPSQGDVEAISSAINKLKNINHKWEVLCQAKNEYFYSKTMPEKESKKDED